MILGDVVLLLLLLGCAALFWQWRRQAELAGTYARRYCQQHQLQLLEIHRASGKLSWHRSAPGWSALFIFDFSSDGESRYQGQLWLFNLHLQQIEVPPYRLPETSA